MKFLPFLQGSLVASAAALLLLAGPAFAANLVITGNTADAEVSGISGGAPSDANGTAATKPRRARCLAVRST